MAEQVNESDVVGGVRIDPRGRNVALAGSESHRRAAFLLHGFAQGVTVECVDWWDGQCGSWLVDQYRVTARTADGQTFSAMGDNVGLACNQVLRLMSRYGGVALYDEFFSK